MLVVFRGRHVKYVSEFWVRHIRYIHELWAAHFMVYLTEIVDKRM